MSCKFNINARRIFRVLILIGFFLFNIYFVSAVLNQTIKDGLLPFVDAEYDYFNGSIDEVMIFNDSLTEGEVSDLYDLGRNAGSYTDTNLVSHWRADDGTADDDKGTNDGTLENGAQAVLEDAVTTWGDVIFSYDYSNLILSIFGTGTTSSNNILKVLGDVNITKDITLGQKITFTLGETIDNIVDGWVRITEVLNLTEDIKSNYRY